MKKIAISQSCFIPWRGYFDIIRQVDEFIINDSWQYNWSSWRNRNTIKTSHGLQWLTIPVKRISHTQTIAETMVAPLFWREKHWKSICHYYAKAPFFSLYSDTIKDLYFSVTREDELLSDINYKFLKAICSILNISTPITRIMQPESCNEKNHALVDLCNKFGATHYLTVPNTKAYIDEKIFAEAGIKLEWMSYNYNAYPQLYPPFASNVSIIDTIFNTKNIF